jgi:hypothetical protein
MPGICLFFFKKTLKGKSQAPVPLMQAPFIIIATEGQGECMQRGQLGHNTVKGAVIRNNA